MYSVQCTEYMCNVHMQLESLCIGYRVHPYKQFSVHEYIEHFLVYISTCRYTLQKMQKEHVLITKDKTLKLFF